MKGCADRAPARLAKWPAVSTQVVPEPKRATLGTGPSTCLGQARSWDRPFDTLGTCSFVGQALQHAWDKSALGTGPSTSPLLGQALQHAWDKPALGDRPSYQRGSRYERRQLNKIPGMKGRLRRCARGRPTLWHGPRTDSAHAYADLCW